MITVLSDGKSIKTTINPAPQIKSVVTSPAPIKTTIKVGQGISGVAGSNILWSSTNW